MQAVYQEPGWIIAYSPTGQGGDFRCDIAISKEVFATLVYEQVGKEKAVTKDCLQILQANGPG